MNRIQLMKSMIALNERIQNRKLGFGEKVYGIFRMAIQSKKALAGAEFNLRAYAVNKEKLDKE